MKILKRYKDEDEWKNTTEDECIKQTEAKGYWMPRTVLDLLKEGNIVGTSFAEYKLSGN